MKGVSLLKERGYIEKLWREEKYRVLLHSQSHYNAIRERLKHKPSYNEINLMVKEAIQIAPSQGSVMNAYDHMWGYFKKLATEEEKETATKLKHQFKHQDIPIEDLLSFLRSLAYQYDVQYLKDSSVLKA